MSNYKFGFVIDPHISPSTPVGRFDDYWQTIFNKLAAVIERGEEQGWDALVIAGDIYNAKQMPYPKQNALITLFKQASFPVYVIIGNHDVYYDRLDTVDDTPLGNLIESGAVQVLTSAFDNILTWVSYSPETEKLPAPNLPPTIPSILVCHAYMGPKKTGFKANAGGWLTFPEVEELGYDIVVAGHDHTEYPVKTLDNGATIFRFGAISRGTSHDHNLFREPQILEIDITDEGWSYDFWVVPHKPSEEVFAYTDILSKEEEREMHHFIQDLRAMSTEGLQSGNIMNIVESMEIPDKIWKYIKPYMIDFGISVE